MGLFDSLGDISMGYLARQREVQDKEASEAFEQNKQSIGNLSKFWTAAYEGARDDPEVQQAFLSRIAEINQLDPRKKNVGKDIARLGDASLIWKGVKRSPESMQPREQSMSAQIQSQQSGPIIPMPQPTGLDFGKDNGPRTESTTPLPGQRSGMAMAPPLPTNLDQSTIPLPAPPTEYLSVYPSQQELESQAYATEEAKAQNALKRELEKQRALKQLNQEFAKEDPSRIQIRNPEHDVLVDGVVTDKGVPKTTAATGARPMEPTFVNMKDGRKNVPVFVTDDPVNPGYWVKEGGKMKDVTEDVLGDYERPQVSTLPSFQNQREVNAWNTVSDNYNNNARPLQERENYYRTIDTMRNLPQGGPSDIVLIYNFVKLNDPNAAREGELQLVQQGAAIPDTWRRYVGRFLTGNVLGPGQRQAIVKASDDVYKGTIAPALSNLNNRFTKVSTDFGVDPANVIRPTYEDEKKNKAIIPPPNPSAAGATGNGGGGSTDPNRVRVRAPDGRSGTVPKDKLADYIKRGYAQIPN